MHIPESAPFSPAQRAWLNGFFAGMVGARAAASPVAPPPAPRPAEEEFPWHDPAMPLDDRMKLAEGRPTERKLMAAMAQLDCGTCGYVCKTYAEAIATGAEKDLTRCSPGGKPTARRLKDLMADAPVVQMSVKGSTPAAEPKTYSRDNPFKARLHSSKPLNAPNSGKDTRHVVLSLRSSGLTYKPGDALGVWPENSPELVEAILDALGASGAEDVPSLRDGSHETSLRDALLRQRSLSAGTELVELLLRHAGAGDQPALKALLAGDDAISPGTSLLDLFTLAPSARPTPAEIVGCLDPLQPRLYSISSSPLAHVDEVHLTVGVVSYVNAQGRACRGVASGFLSHVVRPGQKVRIFIQPSKHFSLPDSADAPAIMVGPGTGIAPFRAFLAHRKATGARGRNWLFFGDRHAASDFLYREELEAQLRDGVLTRLDTAFSRDQERKVYVQDRMLEHAAELWAWLERGAHFFVCGDATRMAADVDAALHRIVADRGGMSPEQAREYVSKLATGHRYQRDVY